MQFQDVVWTGTRFVAAGIGLDDAGVFLDSNDGVTWHRQAKNGAGVASIRLAAGPHGVVAVGSMTSWVSTDGLTWTAHRNAFPKPAWVATTSPSRMSSPGATVGWPSVGETRSARSTAA